MRQQLHRAKQQVQAAGGVCMLAMAAGWVWLLAFAGTVVAFLVCFAILDLGGTLAPLPLPAAVLLMVPVGAVLLVSVLAELLLFGGLGVLAWETYNYLEAGYWTWRSGSDALSLLKIGKAPATGWDVVDRFVVMALAWPVLLTTIVPGLYSIGAALTAYFLYSPRLAQSA